MISSLSKKGLTCLISLVLLLSFSLPVPASIDQGGALLKNGAAGASAETFAAGRVIVKFKNGKSESNLEAAAKQAQLKTVKSLGFTGAKLMQIQSGKTVAEVVQTLKNSKVVEYAEPDYKLQPLLSVSDPLYNQEWGLKNTGQTVKGAAGTAGIDINVEPAWEVTQGTPQTVVAVIDTGADINHPDLKNNIWVNSKEIPNNGIDDDGNGFIDDVNGWDFYHNDNTVFDPADGDKHGTHVSGTIAASADNTGVIGAAPGVKIMPLKFLGPGGGYDSQAILAIDYAKAQGVKLANNSWGGGSYSQALYDAIKNSGMLFVAAAGNSAVNADSTPMYPAAYDLPNILSVAAIDNKGNLASFSNYGPKSVDVAAPGVDILSTVPPQYTGAAGAGLEVSASNYKGIVQGFGLEEFAQASTRQDIVHRALNKLGISAADPILLVQDDQHDAGYTDVLANYTSALSGYNYTVVTIPTDMDGPALSVLNQYRAVLWFTGDSWGKAKFNLTPNDLTNLSQYLTSGHNLYLSGPDVLYGNTQTSLIKDLLKTKITLDGVSIRTLQGVANTTYAGTQYTMDGKLQPWNDQLASNGPEAVVDLVWSGNGYGTAYDYYSGTSMATPHATGTAALVMSAHPGFTVDQVKQALLVAATPLSSLNGKVLTGGMINAADAVGSAASDADIPGVPLPGSVVNGTLDQDTDLDDVFAVHLLKGEKLVATMSSGTPGTDFDLYLYDKTATTVKTGDGIVAYSENPGTSNETISFLAPAEGDYYLDACGYAGSGNYTLQVLLGNGTGTYENTAPEIIYAGAWSTKSDPNASGASLAVTNASGASAELLFNGTGIQYVAQKNSSQGIAKVTLDGAAYAVDLFSKLVQNKAVAFEKNSLQAGTHSIKIEWTGTANRLARKATTINVDAVVVLGP